MTVDLTPSGLTKESMGELRVLIREIAGIVRGVSGVPEESQVEVLRRQAVSRLVTTPPDDQLRLAAVVNLVADLAKLGWQLRWLRGKILGVRPDEGGDVRERRRAQMITRRVEQLRETATREFVSKMETGHVFGGRSATIFDLMRDGRELVRCVEAARISATPLDVLQATIRPYIQFVERDVTCKLTGFSLQDIWRYFRHTWTSAYESVPGRAMLMLIRDAGAPFHPVVGIASIASAASVQPARDAEIGWTREKLLAEAREAPSAELAEWVLATLDGALQSIYTIDFIEERVLPAKLPDVIDDEILHRLMQISSDAKQRHIRQERMSDYKDVNAGSADPGNWELKARSDLFRSKRAGELAVLLSIRNVVLHAFEGRRGKARLAALLETGHGRSAYEKLIRRARSMSMGTAIADLNVCGAIAPYNELLGGKLVAMMAVTPEVVQEYKRRYGNVSSEIASSMAGRPIVRGSDLVFVGTTSLYGIRPSQYDRAGYPAELVGGKQGEFIRYRHLGNTEGVGTAQFTDATKSALSRFLRQEGNESVRVNNVFGEGANPKLRLVREGINALGMKGADEVLVHGMSKTAYGVWLADNVRDYLMGRSKRPRFRFERDADKAGTERICAWWLRRWVLPRLDRNDLVERLRLHRLVRPVAHGARIVLPDRDVAQIVLFR